MMKRRGHAFTQSPDILQQTRRFVRLAEDQSRAAFLLPVTAWETIEAMAPTSRCSHLNLTISIPRGVVFDNEPQDKMNKLKGKKQMFFEKAPNSLFNGAADAGDDPPLLF